MQVKQKVDYTLLTLANTIGHWKFQGNLTDSSGSGNDLASDGLAPEDYIAGYTEDGLTCIELDETNGAEIAAASAGDFNFGTSDFTIEVIFRVGSTGWNSIIEKLDTNHGYWIAVRDTNVIRVHLGDASNFITPQGTITVGDKKWHHLAVVVDRVNDKLYSYVDGVVDINGQDISTVSGSIAPNVDFLIGKIPSYEFDGAIDEVCITTEALTGNLVARRAEGIVNPVRPYEEGFMTKFLPRIHQGNDSLTQFFIPSNMQFLELKELAEFLPNLVKLDSIPERFLTHMATTLGFELGDYNTFSADEKRLLLSYAIWLYSRKGTVAAIEKILDLIGFVDSTVTEVFNPDIIAVYNKAKFSSTLTGASQDFYDNLDADLGQWNDKLNFDDLVNIESNDHMRYRGKTIVGNTVNGILFDSDTSDFLFECEFQEQSSEKVWRFYLDYIDYQNYFWVEIHDVGSPFYYNMYLKKMISGTPTFLKSLTNIENYVDFGTKLKFWARVSKRLGLTTIGIDDVVLINKSYTPESVFTFQKKGVGVSDLGEVDFDNARLYKYSPYGTLFRLYSTSVGIRSLDIDVDGTTTNADAKYEWLQKVIPNYVPSGVEINWTPSY